MGGLGAEGGGEKFEQEEEGEGGEMRGRRGWWGMGNGAVGGLCDMVVDRSDEILEALETG